MALRYAFNSVGFPHDGVEANCERLAAAGYDGVEFRVGEEMLTDLEVAERAREAADKHGLAVPSVAASAVGGTPMATEDERRRERAFDDARTTMEVAEVLGAGTVLLVPGSCGPDLRYDVARENAVESVREVAAIAGEYGLTLGLENIQNDFLTSPLEFRSFVDSVGADNVGAYLDLGNARRYGYPTHWLSILGDRVQALHVKGHDKEREDVTYLLQDDVDWPRVADAVDELGYAGWITPELHPYPSHPERMPSEALSNLRAVFE